MVMRWPGPLYVRTCLLGFVWVSLCVLSCCHRTPTYSYFNKAPARGFEPKSQTPTAFPLHNNLALGCSLLQYVVVLGPQALRLILIWLGLSEALLLLFDVAVAISFLRDDFFKCFSQRRRKGVCRVRERERQLARLLDYLKLEASKKARSKKSDDRQPPTTRQPRGFLSSLTRRRENVKTGRTRRASISETHCMPQTPPDHSSTRMGRSFGRSTRGRFQVPSHAPPPNLKTDPAISP